jgi:hypothetical protein
VGFGPSAGSCGAANDFLSWVPQHASVLVTEPWHGTAEPKVIMMQEEFLPSEQEPERALLTSLLQRARLYDQSSSYMELLAFVNRLPHIAPFNALLINIQKPGLRFAASARDWLVRVNRTVKEGARPLVILWPFGPVAFVYDVEDTEGDSLPADHLGQDGYLRIPDRSFLNYGEREVEAESVSFLVCHRADVQSEAERYLSSFLRTGIPLDQIDVYALMRAAGQIETALGIAARSRVL